MHTETLATVALVALQTAPANGNVLGTFFHNILVQVIVPALPYIAAFFVALTGLGYVWAHGNPQHQEQLRSALGSIAFGIFLVLSAATLVALLVTAGGGTAAAGG